MFQLKRGCPLVRKIVGMLIIPAKIGMKTVLLSKYVFMGTFESTASVIGTIQSRSRGIVVEMNKEAIISKNTLAIRKIGLIFCKRPCLFIESSVSKRNSRLCTKSRRESGRGFILALLEPKLLGSFRNAYREFSFS